MDDIIKWIMDMVNYNSTADTGNTVDCAEYAYHILKDHGVNAELISYPDGNCMVTAFIKGRSPKRIVFHAHIDTAPYGNEAEWRFSPYKASLKKNCICGRGTTDCKGQAAVWIRLMCDKAKEAADNNMEMNYSLMLILTADEENGGTCGIKRLIEEHNAAKDAALVIGEGGGFPVPFKNKLLYTVQTEERTDEKLLCEEASAANSENTEKYTDKDIERIIKKGIAKGYYSELLPEYIKNCCKEKRRLDVEALYEGMETFFDTVKASSADKYIIDVFQKALRQFIPDADILPVITPGCSDNRYLRSLGIPVVGFFPFDERNGIHMHAANEYISIKTLELAYNVMSEVIDRLIYEEDINL
ncbi:MAG: M20/M25/M40 family metallo-hydrolase [Lachnospiraceae bacterium]|nr:M20/M25/M40 family metallo-hydrolase [Lachnospiraceae bacterium]